MSVVYSRKQIITLKYRTLGKNTSLVLIIINLQVTYLMRRENENVLLDKCNTSNLVRNSDLNQKKLATLAELKQN